MGIILVYDCTEEQSFKNIENWMKQIEAHASPNVCKALIANKVDLESERKVTKEQGE